MEGLAQACRVVLNSLRLDNCDPTLSSRYLHTYNEEGHQFVIDTKRSYDSCSAVNSPTNNDPSEEQERDGDVKHLRTFIFHPASQTRVLARLVMDPFSTETRTRLSRALLWSG